MIQSIFFNDDFRLRILLSLVLFSCLFTVGYVYASSVLIDDNISLKIITMLKDSSSINDSIKASVIKP